MIEFSAGKNDNDATILFYVAKAVSSATSTAWAPSADRSRAGAQRSPGVSSVPSLLATRYSMLATLVAAQPRCEICGLVRICEGALRAALQKIE